MTTKKCNFRRGCNNFATAKTKSGRPSKLCQHHYDQQRKWDEKRKTNPTRIKYCQERKNKPQRIAWTKAYDKKRNKDPKRRKAQNKSVLKWRINNPHRAKQVLEKVNKSTKRRLYNVKYSAKHRDINVTLTDDEIKKVLLRNRCEYCGMDDDMVGIDRIDSNKGYEKGNVVSCCKICNIMKRKYNIDIFVKICTHIASTQGRLQNKQFYSDCFKDVSRAGFAQYRGSAKRRGKKFELTRQLFDEITKENCYLCDKRNSATHHNGIDRVNNEKGYVEGNMKSCCGTCNYMKNEFELSVFIDHCHKIALLRK
eukprot:507744_1